MYEYDGESYSPLLQFTDVLANSARLDREALPTSNLAPSLRSTWPEDVSQEVTDGSGARG
jgi:hypothetical protein